VKSKQVNTNHVKYFVHPKVDTILNRTNQLIRQVKDTIVHEGSSLKALSEGQTSFLHLQEEFSASGFLNHPQSDSYSSTVTVSLVTSVVNSSCGSDT